MLVTALLVYRWPSERSTAPSSSATYRGRRRTPPCVRRALGRLARRRSLSRAATALLLVLGATIASAALADPLGIAAGPGNKGRRRARGRRPGKRFAAVLVAAAAATVILSGVLELTVRALERRAG